MARFLYYSQKATSRIFYFDWATLQPYTYTRIQQYTHLYLNKYASKESFALSKQGQIDKWFSELPVTFIYNVNSRKLYDASYYFLIIISSQNKWLKVERSNSGSSCQCFLVLIDEQFMQRMFRETTQFLGFSVLKPANSFTGPGAVRNRISLKMV